MKKIKLTLNKTTVSRLQDDQQAKVFGGEQPTTLQTTCVKETEYPICGWFGCIGAASCCSLYGMSCDISKVTDKCDPTF